MTSSSDTKSAEASGPLEDLMKDKDLLPEKVQIGYNFAIILEDSKTLQRPFFKVHS